MEQEKDSFGFVRRSPPKLESRFDNKLMLIQIVGHSMSVQGYIY